MDINSGATSPRVNSGVPQSEQKLRVERLPLPARTEYVFGVPMTSVSDTRTMTPEAKGAPLERWQSRQWQLSIATGVRAHAYRIDPHIHPPENGAVMPQFPPAYASRSAGTLGQASRGFAPRKPMRKPPARSRRDARELSTAKTNRLISGIRSPRQRSTVDTMEMPSADVSRTSATSEKMNAAINNKRPI
jgi:hypothetical protein